MFAFDRRIVAEHKDVLKRELEIVRGLEDAVKLLIQDPLSNPQLLTDCQRLFEKEEVSIQGRLCFLDNAVNSVNVLLRQNEDQLELALEQLRDNSV